MSVVENEFTILIQFGTMCSSLNSTLARLCSQMKQTGPSHTCVTRSGQEEEDLLGIVANCDVSRASARRIFCHQVPRVQDFLEVWRHRANDLRAGLSILQISINPDNCIAKG